MRDIQERRKQLIFRSWHRGTKEMDLLLGSFADQYVPDFDEAQLALYEETLLESDPDLYNWMSGREALPQEKANPVLLKMIKHRFVRQD